MNKPYTVQSAKEGFFVIKVLNYTKVKGGVIDVSVVRVAGPFDNYKQALITAREYNNSPFQNVRNN